MITSAPPSARNSAQTAESGESHARSRQAIRRRLIDLGDVIDARSKLRMRKPPLTSCVWTFWRSNRFRHQLAFGSVAAPMAMLSGHSCTPSGSVCS
jgi:hypothetical protein